MGRSDGFWVFHRKKVDLTALFNQPEEKLWLVIKENYGSPYVFQNPDFDQKQGKSEKDLLQIKGGFKLEKNSVIKLGRVRLRVRDMDNQPRSQFNQARLVNQHSNKFSLSARPKVSSNRLPHDDRLELDDIQLDNDLRS